jgi:hypothetical protein
MTHWQHERWRAQTSWHRPTLTSDDVAALLGPIHSTIALQLATLAYRRGPDTELRWSPAQVYTHIAEHHPAHASFIPRLFPLTASLAPARLPFTHTAQPQPDGPGVRRPHLGSP